MAGAAITWQSKKQESVTLSSSEAEFVAVALATKEGLWLQTILKELQICKPLQLKIFCDNISCIYLAKNPKHSEKTKHVDLKYHFIRELTEENKLTLEFTPTSHMWADFLTKPLSVDKFEACCKNLGLQRLITN